LTRSHARTTALLPSYLSGPPAPGNLYGAFERTLPLPDGVDANKLEAEYNNGVLEITAPIAASALPRRIEVKSAPAAKKMTA
jgi:hypothetical protein